MANEISQFREDSSEFNDKPDKNDGQNSLWKDATPTVKKDNGPSNGNGTHHLLTPQSIPAEDSSPKDPDDSNRTTLPIDPTTETRVFDNLLESFEPEGVKKLTQRVEQLLGEIYPDWPESPSCRLEIHRGKLTVKTTFNPSTTEAALPPKDPNITFHIAKVGALVAEIFLLFQHLSQHEDTDKKNPIKSIINATNGTLSPGKPDVETIINAVKDSSECRDPNLSRIIKSLVSIGLRIKAQSGNYSPSQDL